MAYFLGIDAGATKTNCVLGTETDVLARAHPTRRWSFCRNPLTLRWAHCGARRTFLLPEIDVVATFSDRMTTVLRRKTSTAFDSLRRLQAVFSGGCPGEVVVIYWARNLAERKEARYANDSIFSRYAAVEVDYRCFSVGVGECGGCAGGDCSLHSTDWIVEPGDRRTSRSAAPYQAVCRTTVSKYAVRRFQHQVL